MVYPIQLRSIIGDTSNLSTFKSEDGKEDKLEIHITGYRITGGDAAELTAQAILDAIKTDGDDQINMTRRPVRLRQGDGIFFKARQRKGRSDTIEFRSHRKSFQFPVGRPLISGRISISRLPNSRENFSLSNWRVDLTLSLNPTRFVRHNYSGELISAARLGDARYFTAEKFLSNRINRKNSHGERILDDNDNCILNHRALLQSTSTVFRTIRNYYIEYSIGLVLDRIVRSSRSSGAQIFGTPIFNIRKVETYWERAAPNPISFVWNAFEPFISRGQFAAIGYRPPTSLSGIGNALMLATDLHPGIKLKLYAKTNQRVRFEIETDLAKLRGNQLSQHTTETLAELLSKIDEVRELAAEQLSEATCYLRRSSACSHDFALLLEFLDLVGECCPDLHDRSTLLTALVIARSYTHRIDDPLRRVIRRLKNRGVLQVSGRSVVTVTERYIPAIELFATYPADGNMGNFDR